MRRSSLLALCLCTCVSASLAGQASHNPAVLLSDPGALQNTDQLPLAPSTTSTIYVAQAGVLQFNLASYLAWYQGKFWAMWSAGLVNEDDRGQKILYATSPDGHTWSAAQVLVEGDDGMASPGTWISRSMYVQDGHLYALAAHFGGTPHSTGAKDGEKEDWPNLKLIRFQWSGKQWKNLGVYVENCMNNFPPRRFGDRLFMTCRDSYTLMHTALASSAAGDHWTVSALPTSVPESWMSEPSWYIDPQGIGHILFRDAGKSKYLYHSISNDQGKTWSAPVRTNYPDATSKNYSWRLSNGWYFLINNPDQKKRDPLAISFSRDGWTFGHPMALRKNAPALRFPGHAKGSHSFQYAHAIEHAGSLWVIYSVNKEDIQVSEFKLSDFHLE